MNDKNDLTTDTKVFLTSRLSFSLCLVTLVSKFCSIDVAELTELLYTTSCYHLAATKIHLNTATAGVMTRRAETVTQKMNDRMLKPKRNKYHQIATCPWLPHNFLTNT